MQQHNPYHDASNAYSSNKAAGLSNPRTLEAQILTKAAAKLDVMRSLMKEGEAPDLHELGDALEYNKKLWVVFADSMGDDDHDLPLEIKNNISNLAIFMMKRTLEVLADPQPEKLDAIIDINRQIASGLMKSPQKEAGTVNAEEPKTTSANYQSSSFDA